MEKMKLKVDDDSNKLKYVSIIRQNNGASIQDTKTNIEDNKVVLQCDYFDTDELKVFKETMEDLMSKGATIQLFQDDREVQIDYISNLISSYEQIAEDRERLDDRILGDD
ncbi:hypothetical protein [Bhargavaea beijingensis]|uniref:Uncharacterized protein n=1 Tax=Bhargavaea beijingensis TaxID=426756 RepID=A0A1G7GHU1_9BACL|nr:hypothetical protein [Bhargavaea beijingensis]RSK29715.1 hypothetical protein EJA12_10905 [Bhargavaea beijingensis]SDE87728.1 hypothetical protein SAMN04488126_12640 [Bhargavaea beijingensis]